MEWDIVIVLGEIVGLALLVGKPIMNLNSSITKLTARLDTLDKTAEDNKAALKEHQKKDSESHRKLWEYNQTQDNRLDSHEKRIVKLETQQEE